MLLATIEKQDGYAMLLGLVIFVACFIIGIGRWFTRFEDHFFTAWQRQMEGKKRMLRVIEVRSRMNIPKMCRWLKFFGYRIVNNDELVWLMKDEFCPSNVRGYDPTSDEFLEIVSFPGGSKSIDRTRKPFGIINEVTLIGVTKMEDDAPALPRKIAVPQNPTAAP